MATHSANCSRDGVYYAASGSASGWTSSSKFYSGKDSTWYRSKVTFTTGSFVGVSQSSKRFVMQLTIDSTASPCGCMATLTTKSLVPNKIMNDNANGPHADLTAGCIGQSYAYADSAATTESTGTNKSSGYTFYFSFSSASIQPNTTYHVYCHYKSGRGSSTGWTRCNASAISAWVEYTPNWRLTLNTSTGVASFTGAGDYAHNTTAPTTATASTGYHLTKYTGTNVSGNTQDWTISGSPTTHSDNWTMTLNRTATVYAAANTHNFTANANGGSGGQSATSTSYGSTVTVTDPTRSGYRFAGWSWSSDAGFTFQDPGIGFPVYRSNTSYVAWSLVDNYGRYTITSPGSSSSNWQNTRIAVYPVQANETVTISGQVRIVSNSAGLAANFYHGEKANDYGNCKLSISTTGGVWQDFSFSRKFTSACDAYFEIYSSDLANKSGSIQFDLRAITIHRSKQGYVPTTLTMPNAAVTLTALWIPTYQVTVRTGSINAYFSDGDIGSGCTVYTKNGISAGYEYTYTKTHDTPIVLPDVYREPDNFIHDIHLYYNDDSTGYVTAEVPETREYSFACWMLSNTNFNGSSYTTNAAATLEADWLIDSDPPEVYLPDYVPNRVGYTFSGWSIDSSGNDILVDDWLFITGDRSLYAQWDINYHYVYVHDFYGGCISQQLCAYGSTVTLPAIPASEQIILDPWDACDYTFSCDSNSWLEYANIYSEFSANGTYYVEYYTPSEGWCDQYMRPGDTFSLPDGNVYVFIDYNQTAYVTCFQPTILPADSQGYKKFVGWHTDDRLLPSFVPHNALIEYHTDIDDGYNSSAEYFAIFEDDNATHIYHRDGSSFKITEPFVFDGTTANNANRCYIKADNRWKTVQEYLDEL